MKLAVADFETDPFLAYRTPAPFAVGLYDGETYWQHWGDDCIEAFLAHLASLDEPLMIYFHNGGGFDFWFLLWHMEDDAKIINGKIVKAHIGEHELRDSWKILPFPLDQYKKDKIDYSKMERKQRHKHRREIERYMKNDCLYLYDLVFAFRRDFGNKLTVGGASIELLQSFHPFDRIPANPEGMALDAELRQFYFGGRNQCFAKGIIDGPVTIYDMNSNYLSAMKSFQHPTRLDMNVKRGKEAKIGSKTMFAVIRAKNNGALPMRAEDGSLRFDVETGIFHTTIHEIEAGLDTETLRVQEVLAVYDFLSTENFAEYVDHVSETRLAAKARGDGAADIATKFVGNSSYGKTAQNPANYRDWKLARGPLDDPWELEFEAFDWFVHSKPAIVQTFYNVAIGASITGAARAMLLRGLAKADDTVYCDTDSIICRKLSGVEMHGKKLGAWKVEAEGDQIAIAGKKLYAVFRDGECIKKASKGGKLTGADIRDIASGKRPMVEFVNPAPNFKLNGTANFITRRFSETAKPARAPRST